MTQVIGSFLVTLGEKNMHFTYVLRFLNEFFSINHFLLLLVKKALVSNQEKVEIS